MNDQNDFKQPMGEIESDKEDVQQKQVDSDPWGAKPAQ